MTVGAIFVCALHHCCNIFFITPSLTEAIMSFDSNSENRFKGIRPDIDEETFLSIKHLCLPCFHSLTHADTHPVCAADAQSHMEDLQVI